MRKFAKIEITDELVERFMSKVDKKDGNPYECWEWTGCKDGWGYGRICINNKERGAHRISFAIHYGNIPKGMMVLHKCDNPSCVNPRHLFYGTHSDNMKDASKKGRLGQKGEDHPCVKLTREQAMSIKYDEPRDSPSNIAKKYGVVKGTISHIWAGRTWCHI